jgi:hypothetical protein
LFEGDAVPKLGGNRDVVTGARGQIQAKAIGSNFDLGARDDSHA